MLKTFIGDLSPSSRPSLVNFTRRTPRQEAILWRMLRYSGEGGSECCCRLNGRDVKIQNLSVSRLTESRRRNNKANHRYICIHSLFVQHTAAFAITWTFRESKNRSTFAKLRSSSRFLRRLLERFRRMITTSHRPCLPDLRNLTR